MSKFPSIPIALMSSPEADSPASTGANYNPETDRPSPEWVRGTCPQCGEMVVSNIFYVEGKGFMVALECWASFQANPTCTYRKLL